MRFRLLTICIPVVLGLMMVPALAQTPLALPDSMPGRLLAEWLAAFNAGNPAALDVFYRDHRDQAVTMFQTMFARSTTGGFTPVRVERSTPAVLTVLVEERSSEQLHRLELAVSEIDATAV